MNNDKVSVNRYSKGCSSFEVEKYMAMIGRHACVPEANLLRTSCRMTTFEILQIRVHFFT